MVHIHLIAEDSHIIRAAHLLQDHLDIALRDSGITVVAEPASTPFVSFDGNTGKIGYVSKVSFCRSLALLVSHAKQNKPFSLEETVDFDEAGISLDLSRGAVLKPEAVKKYMRYMATMGLDYVLLYIEDIYTIPELPYFGYMRGRYTEEELRDIDRYGAELGVEVIPLIQTASHLEHYLKWGENWGCRCTEKTLLVGSEDVYKLIDQMISTISRCFTTKRIHLGMDEAFDLNMGNYFARNGLQDLGDVFAYHLERVLQIAKKYDLSPMCWGPLKSDRGTDVNRIRQIKGNENISTFAGTYSYISKETFLKICAPYKEWLGEEFSRRLCFCGPIWTWTGSVCDNKLTYSLCEHLLTMCKKYGFRKVLGTVWGDDGSECNHFLSLFGAQIYAEYKYSNNVSLSSVMERFEYITGISAQAFMDMSDFHMVPNRSENLAQYTNGHLCVHDFIGKKLMWQDIMVGLKDHQLFDVPMSQPYADLASKFHNYREQCGDLDLQFQFIESLFDMMSAKCAIAEQLKPRYEQNDRAYLKLAADQLLPDLAVKVENTRKLYRDMWLADNKPFGLEVIDVRYGGLIARIDSAIYRLNEYLEGRINRLEELDEPRLMMECQDSLYYTRHISSCTRIWM